MGVVQCQKRETISHLFLKEKIAEKVWKRYCGAVCKIEKRLHLKQSVRLSWKNCQLKIGSSFQGIPILILWFI